LARKRKRKSRRRQEGRKILELIPQYSIESGEDKPVTAARKYIQAIAQYVEENHFLFPSLRDLQPQPQPVKAPVAVAK